jgi:serine/threonine protein kinase/tetratricopeptide (TPR) repeat protein
MTRDEKPHEPGERTTVNSRGGPAVERRIGAYRVLRELGHGGMGTVYLAARADDQYQKRVAVKVVRGLNSAEVLRHFRRERQILAGLDHPNIARLFDGGTTDDDLPYFVMEYVEGEPVDRFCDQRKLSIQERLKLFQGVCAAVQYAHRNLVVHRDIKPTNILVTAEGVPKLMDFGIAKLLNPGVAGEVPTVTDVAMTPEYASPEQARGGPITTAADVYSLGVVLYELLTGHRPYKLTTHNTLEVLKAVCEEEPERPSTAVARTEIPALPEGAGQETTAESVSRTREGTPERLKRRLRGDLDNIVLMALRKEPLRRYGSVEALSEDIRRYLEGRPVTARKTTASYRASKFVRRNRTAVTVAAVLTTVIIVSVVGGFLAVRRQARVAEAERDRARAAAEKAERINAFVRDMLGSADPRIAGRDVTVASVLDAASARVEPELGSQPDLKAAVLSTLGTTYEGLGLLEPAERLLKAALEAKIAAYGPEHVEVARSLDALARVAEDRGDLKEAERLDRQALAMLQRVGASEREEAVTVKGDLARVLEGLGDTAAAEALYREVLALERTLGGARSEGVAATLNNLGVLLGQRGDWAGAEPLHREALDIVREVRGPEDPDVAAGMNTLGAVLESKGDLVGAEAMYRESLAMRRKLLGPDHPETTRSMYALAYLLRVKGDPEGALRMCHEVLALRGPNLPDGHPMVAATLQVEGLSLMDLGRAREAEPFFRESLELRRRSLPPGHWLVAAAESSLGACLGARGRYGEAEGLLLRGYEGLKASRGDAHPLTIDTRRRLVTLYKAWGKPDRAREYEAPVGQSAHRSSPR